MSTIIINEKHDQRAVRARIYNLAKTSMMELLCENSECLKAFTKIIFTKMIERRCFAGSKYTSEDPGQIKLDSFMTEVPII